MSGKNFREIPFNYTSADDAQIVRILFGEAVWYALLQIRIKRTTGRLARLLMRIMGDMFMIHRNPYLLQELISNQKRRQRLIQEMLADLALIEDKSESSEALHLIITQCRAKIHQLSRQFATIKEKRRRMQNLLGAIVGPENIRFDPFTLISHVTDATDWRLYPPLAVVWPSTESQVAAILEAIQQIGVHAIPRGAGTGLTGGAVPVSENCVMINMEKLNHIYGIEWHSLQYADTNTINVPLLHLEAGVITGDAMAFAESRDLVFATDPTSSWSCTIGGNIAENAGGKKAVLWGTAIDNLWSFNMVVPGGLNLEIQRVNHPLRKINPEDTVYFDVCNQHNGQCLRTIALKGTDIRQKGLGKDITNKALKGLPGLQKEGTDGVITSAKFILYEAYAHKSTGCLEFFGNDLDEAARVIQDISKCFVNKGKEALMALEHFDEEYVRAIRYKTKAPRHESPKAVILLDLVAHTAPQIERAQTRLAEIIKKYTSSVLFFAADEAEAERYWQDRKKLGAIAARTNAFKLNEDIVIPISALAEFADFVDQYNIKEDRFNQISVVWQLSNYIATTRPSSDSQWLNSKLPQAETLFERTQAKLELAGKEHLRQETHLKQLLNQLQDLFRGYTDILAGMGPILAEIRNHLIVIATHMHAGDGNVHVNIPVFSNDRDMMIRALETAEAVMAKAVELGGVVSGEHGIGFTKLNYLAPSRVRELVDYLHETDPDALINPGKLTDTAIPGLIFTPSFSLLRIESEILKYSSLKTLFDKISKCIRCGKCKPNCCVFYPAEQLYYHPRNKNLAIATLIEAILYDAQRLRSTRFGFLSYLEEIADHCTICHKCAAPCPVDIDTGEVSILERRLLEAQKYKKTPFRTLLTLGYLKSRSPWSNLFIRKGMLQWGVGLQRIAFRANRLLPQSQTPSPSTLKLLLNSPLTTVSRHPLTHFLPKCQPDQALVIHPPDTQYAVFYFPGCGSERLFSQIGLASIYVLLKTGAMIILPPPFLCCGYPARVNAKTTWEEHTTLSNIIIFNQLRNMFHHLQFQGCAVSCGTCREALHDLGIESIFDAPLVDISQLALTQGLQLKEDHHYFYHQPCHDSLNGQAERLLLDHGARQITTVPHCCSEAGTLALSRPTIASSMRTRKAKALNEAVGHQRGSSVILTNCPACIQGLGRHPRLNLRPQHISEVVAAAIGGPEWQKEIQPMLNRSEIITI